METNCSRQEVCSSGWERRRAEKVVGAGCGHGVASGEGRCGSGQRETER